MIRKAISFKSMSVFEKKVFEKIEEIDNEAEEVKEKIFNFYGLRLDFEVNLL